MKTAEETQEQRQKLELESTQISEQERIDNISEIIAKREKTRQKAEEKKAKKFEESLRNILVLGAGHLNSHIIHALRQHARFTVVDRRDPEYIFLNPFVAKELDRSRYKGYQFSEHDIERNMIKLLNMGEYDFIIYGLSIQDEVFSNANPNFTQTVNTVYTQAMMNAIADSQTKAKILFLSTDKVYGDQGCPEDLGPPDNRWWQEFKISELDVPNPTGVKAISRYNQELVIKGMCKTYGIDYMIFRIGNLYGRYTPADNVINNMFVNAMKTDIVPIYGDKFASRDFVDIEDVARTVYEQLIEKYNPAVWNEVYNIGGMMNSRTYIWGLAYLIKMRISGEKFQDLEKLPYLRPFMSTKIREYPARCYEDKREAGIRIWLDCKKAFDKLGYRPGHLKQGGMEWEKSIMQTFLWAAGVFLNYDQDKMTEMRKIFTAKYKVKEDGTVIL